MKIEIGNKFGQEVSRMELAEHIIINGAREC